MFSEAAPLEGAHSTESSVRDLLPHTWHAFLAKFGRLTDVQLKAIPLILQGKSTLVCAPTASGKTEAVVVPLIERLWENKRSTEIAKIPDADDGDGLVLIVSPTRALASDLFRRLTALMGQRKDLLLSIRTGDKRQKVGEAGRGEVMLVTPESLDGAIVRKTAKFKRLQAIILDELHLMQGSGRGDQLRMLLYRLDRIAPGYQRCGLSATVEDADGLAKLFLGGKAIAVRSGEVQRGRERLLDLELRGFSGGIKGAAQQIATFIAEGKYRKTLIFVNKRKDAEQLGAALRDTVQAVEGVMVHHGSLEKQQRQEVEGKLLRLRSWACVSTMTLELGIDIGDIDAVVMVSPPPDVASFTQRVGRAGRRSGQIKALGLYEDAFEHERFIFAERCAASRLSFSERWPFRPWILAQQAISLAYQNKRGTSVTAEGLYQRLPPDAAARYNVAACTALLRQTAEAGFLRAVSGGHFVPEPLAQQLFETGQIHSTLETAPSLKVVDSLTGQILGEIDPKRLLQQRLQSGTDSAAASTFQLAGRTRTISKVDRGVVTVKTSKDGSEGGGDFFNPSGAPICPASEAAALGAHLGCPPTNLWYQPIDSARFFLIHFLGTLRGQLLASLLRHLRYRVVSGRAAFWFVVQQTESSAAIRWDRPLSERFDPQSTLMSVLSNASDELLERLQPGPFSAATPPELLNAWLADTYQLLSLAHHLTLTPKTPAWLPPPPL